jgi:ketosteroid isomerase-like protein
MSPVESSSSNNIKTVQRLYQAFAEGDISAIKGFLDPDVEWGEPDNPHNPAGGTRHGHDGFLAWVKIGREAEDVLDLEPRQFLSGEDSVAVVGYTRCRAKNTGRIYETDFVHLFIMKDGKVIKFQEFFDTFAAAEAFRE